MNLIVSGNEAELKKYDEPPQGEIFSRCDYNFHETQSPFGNQKGVKLEIIGDCNNSIRHVSKIYCTMEVEHKILPAPVQ